MTVSMPIENGASCAEAGSTQRRNTDGDLDASRAAKSSAGAVSFSTCRTIASRAGVDAALISYYFGSKRGLFAAVMRLVDAFIDALPARGDSPRANITYPPNGAVETGPALKSCEHAWYQGLAAMARGGAPLILDEVFLSGAAAQVYMRATLRGLHVLWVGIRCDPAVAAAREAQRPDRIPGMARKQAPSVHAGMSYDIEVDTTDLLPDTCARVIAAHVNS